jgi:hypothetical protein
VSVPVGLTVCQLVCACARFIIVCTKCDQLYPLPTHTHKHEQHTHAGLHDKIELKAGEALFLPKEVWQAQVF